MPHNFMPRNYQKPFFNAMADGYKRAVEVWHRRAGKDKVFLNFVAKEAIMKVGVYYYFFPTFAQGRKVIWDGIDRNGFPYMDHFPQELRSKTRNDEMKIILTNGSIFQIVGTDNIDSIMGTNPVGCVFSEYSLQNPQAWDYIRPILSENDGWAVFNFTPRGRNHAFILREMAKNNKNWWFEELTVDDTRRPDGKPVIGPEAIQAERESGMDEAMIQQEYYCSFDAMLSNCFFGDSLARHNNTMTGTTGRLEEKRGDLEFLQDGKGYLEIWRYPYHLVQDWDSFHWSNRYCIGSDIAEGLGQDYSVAYVLDRHTKEIVARMRSNTIDSHSWAILLVRLSQWYDNALIVPERNGSGISVCKYLGDKNANVYANTIPAKAGSGLTKQIGWIETKSSKYDICGDLKDYFATTQATVYDALLITECATFIRTDSERLEADEGFHDDMVIAAALTIQGHYFIHTKAEKIDPGPQGWLKREKMEEANNWAA
jgi:hypothetical protein